MGSLFTGSSKSVTDAKPWAPQGAALQGAFNSAQDNYNAKKDTPWYQGDLYATLDPTTKAALQQMQGFQTGQGATNANTVTSAGQSLVNPGAYTGAIGNYGAAASADPTQGNIAAARQYADNPAINGMVDAASRDVSRNLYEGALPGIDRAASGSGNLNSTRAGVQAGIAQRGAQDQIGDISANIRGAAYDKGLGLAEGARSTNLSALGQTAGLYGGALGQGLGAIGQGNALSLGNLDSSIKAGQIGQADRQGVDNAGLKAWTGNDNRANDLLQQYYSIIGNKNWGGTSTKTDTSTQSILSQLVGAATAAAAFA
jgi:hypothetical protein